ncbi:MAG: CPBP family intramembrane metalloprotease [Spirochaetota bacterium]|nr:MAG: CPBP family intramembrane metalloprotease [Spirochaetota bacterium]
MPTIKAFIKRYPVLNYYGLTFVISWGAIFTLIGSRGIPATKEQFDMMLPVGIVALLGGPIIAGILLTGLADGRAGFRELRSLLFKWQVRGLWYAVALLAAPLMLAASLIVLSLIYPGFPPGIFATNDKAPLLLMGIISGVMVGICEELGWTGFALPRLRLHYSILTTGLMMGVLWGAWHIASHAVLASGVYAAPFSPAFYVVARGLSLLLGPLLAFRVLMVWVYDRTGSLLVAILMHISYTAFTIILEPPAIAGVPLLIYDIVLAAVVWAAVAVVAVANGGRLERGTIGRTR